MKIVIFGLTISSSWGNGHATLWRGLCRALTRRGHRVVFFERDVPYYAAHRDYYELPGGELRLYSTWESTLPAAKDQLADADVGMVTSYCPDGLAAAELVMSSGVRRRVFYDLDTPVTLGRWRAGEPLTYVGARGFADYDLVLSYTGGRALRDLREEMGATRVAPLYGSVDPEVHHPVTPVATYQADLSYLGTYAEDRQATLERLFLESARLLPKQRFLIGGAQYPVDFPWAKNLYFVRHVPPPEHPAFYSSARVTLNVTRKVMADMGYCPSGRLFEAAACRTPILSDCWQGLDTFFRPGAEIAIAHDTAEAVSVLQLSDQELTRMAEAARERVLAEHTADRRAAELERFLEAPETADGVAANSGATRIGDKPEMIGA